MGQKIKSMIDEKKSNQEILSTLGIGRSQLTNYKQVIALKKLDELNQGKLLNDIVKENQGVRIEKRKVKASLPNTDNISNDIEKNLKQKVKQKSYKITLDKRMIEDIEKQKHDAKERGVGKYEYFLDGKWQIYVPFHTGGEVSPKHPSDEVLHMQNTLLRFKIKEDITKYKKEYDFRLKAIQNKCKIT